MHAQFNSTRPFYLGVFPVTQADFTPKGLGSDTARLKKPNTFARLMHRPELGALSGVVMVSCTIDEKGDVRDAAIEKSTNVSFNPSALAAVKKWKFKPAKVDGAPVAKKVTIPLKFTVDET